MVAVALAARRFALDGREDPLGADGPAAGVCRRVAAGVYFAQLHSGERLDAVKMIVLQ